MISNFNTFDSFFWFSGRDDTSLYSAEAKKSSIGFIASKDVTLVLLENAGWRFELKTVVGGIDLAFLPVSV